jgi:antitoxin VapB
MSLNIKNPETHRLVAELAGLTGKTLTGAVTDAVRSALEEERRRRGRRGMAKELLAIGHRCKPYLDPPVSSSNHGDELFNDEGLPE